MRNIRNHVKMGEKGMELVSQVNCWVIDSSHLYFESSIVLCFHRADLKHDYMIATRWQE